MNKNRSKEEGVVWIDGRLGKCGGLEFSFVFYVFVWKWMMRKCLWKNDVLVLLI